MGLMHWVRTAFTSAEGVSEKAGELPDDFIGKSLFFNYLDAQSAIILFFSPSRGWVGANATFYKTFDIDNMETFRDRYERIFDFFSEYEIFAENDEAWLKQLEYDQGQDHKVRMTLPNGEEALYSLRAKRIKSGDNGLYFLEMEDVTQQERGRLERESADAAKRKFLSNISHEFRTPMNGIMGFVDLLKQSHPSSTQRDYIEMIDRSAKHMMNNVESLLDLAQMQNGKLQLEPTEFKPVGELERLFEHYGYEARQRSVLFSAFVDPKLPTYIEADQRKFRQILSLLIDNAVKFSDAGDRVQVDVRVLKKPDIDRYTIGVSVKDTGAGIEEERLPVITQPFESGEHSDYRLGVGLTLAEGLLQMMGSELSIASQKGRGSHFSFAMDVLGTTVPSFDSVRDQRAKVVLFDDALRHDANLLSRYLKSFGVMVTKVHHSETIDCDETDLLYIVARGEHSGWLMQMGALTSHPCRIVLLCEEDASIPAAAGNLVDYTLKKPLTPTRISKHLSQVLRLPATNSKYPTVAEGKVKALIVEDNIINQRLIKLLLQDYNLAVTTADNGSEAVELCRKYPFDIIFMDIDMPVKDGIEATHDIRRLSLFRGKPAPIIALTALAMQGDRERILSEGLDDYISKPLGREKLECILEKHLSEAVQA